MTTRPTIKPFEGKNVIPIYGVPGAGKTTKLISIMQELLKGGASPGEIGFASFTRTASYEGRDRAAAALEIPKSRFKFYATIHSLCYQQANPRPKILDTDDYKEIAQAVGDLSIRGNYAFKPLTDDGVFSYGMGSGDYLLSLISLARSHMVPLAELIEDPFVIYDMDMRGVRKQMAVEFNDALERYKHTNRKIDFGDMLEIGQRATRLPVKYAFIDEAQDLTNLQWLAVDNLFGEAETIYVGGDDDQAIYDFSGGNSEVFRAMGDKPSVVKLEHSHRCPRKVFAVAERALVNIEDRVEKRVIPQDVDGGVDIIGSLHDIREVIKEGEWLFLVRQHSHAINIEQYLRDQYYYFKGSRGGRSVSDRQWAMIQLHGRIQRNEEVYTTELGSYYKSLKIGHGVAQGYKTSVIDKLEKNNVEVILPETLVAEYGLLPAAMAEPWYEMLQEIPRTQREYIQGVLERGERSKEPRIKVSTIHSAKGTQAENVVVCGRLGQLSRDSLDRGKLDEYRVAYVAITRAQQNLYLYLTGDRDDWEFYHRSFKEIIFSDRLDNDQE